MLSARIGIVGRKLTIENNVKSGVDARLDLTLSPDLRRTVSPLAQIKRVGAGAVILRDVIEHLDDATIALRNIRRILKPGGALYVTFPPYYSPFGGHQHLLGNTAGKFPFMHLLPEALFTPLIQSGIERNRIEVERIRKIRMTTSKFHRAARAAGFTITDEKLYFIRPVFKMKFGLPPIAANFVRPIPGLRDIVALEAGYILKNG